MVGYALAGLIFIAFVFAAWQLKLARIHLHTVTQRAARLEKELAAQEHSSSALRDALLKGIDDALLVLDAKQTILFANPTAETMLGQHLVGETLLGAVRHPELDSLLRDALKVHGESVERRIEFDRHVLHARAIAPSGDDSPDAYEVLSLHDVTELQRLERARREMVSNITHELSTPITSISLLAETLINVALNEKPKRVRKMAKDIQREVHTLAQLVQEMRDLSLIESGQMPVRLTPTPLLPLVQASVEQIESLAEGKQLSITVDVPENLCVLADDHQIRRAIKNILHNATKFSPEQGNIAIVATATDTEAILSITDHGPGIPAEDVPRVFERFFQVDRSRREGTGLGLAIVRHIVLAHGGRTWAESVQGQGATFYIALALADSQPGDEAAETEASAAPEPDSAAP